MEVRPAPLSPPGAVGRQSERQLPGAVWAVTCSSARGQRWLLDGCGRWGPAVTLGVGGRAVGQQPWRPVQEFRGEALGPAAPEEVCEPGTPSLLTCSHAHALSEEGDKSRRGQAACWTWGCGGGAGGQAVCQGGFSGRDGRAEVCLPSYREQRCRDVTTSAWLVRPRFRARPQRQPRCLEASFPLGPKVETGRLKLGFVWKQRCAAVSGAG